MFKMEKSLEKKSIENKYVKFWIEDEIMHVYYKKGCVIGKEAAEDIVKIRLELQKGDNYKGLAYVDHIGKITPDARKYLSKEGYLGMEKVAIVISTPIKAMLGNIFINIDKPIKPTRLFTNTDDAKKWLKK